MSDILEKINELGIVERQVLILRYVCNESWKNIARILQYDVRQIYRIKNNALKALNVTMVTFLQKDVTIVQE